MYLDDLIPLLNSVKRYDGYVSALCPFHDDRSPSLLVFETKPGQKHGWFQCLGCDARGTHEYLYSVLEGAPVRVVPQEKTSWGLPPLPDTQEDWEALAYASHNAIRDRPHLGWYWQLRGVDSRIEPNKLGWYRGWYTVPVFDKEGDFTRLILRAGEHIEKSTGLRYYTSPGHPVIHVPDRRKFYEATSIAIVFGTVDALALATLGIPVCTSTAGKAQFDPTWLSAMSPYVYVIPDMGEETTAIELANKIGGRARVVRLTYPDHCKDPADYLKFDRGKQLQKELARYFS
jgi:DNA primase